MKSMIGFLLVASLSGCSGAFLGSKVNTDVSPAVAVSERRALESQTLSSLSALERSVNDFLQARRRIPKTLDELVPEFLGEIPVVELGIKGYKPKNKVAYYPSSIIVDGRINGAALDDTGGWGYAFNNRQVIVFVDCTQKRMNGTSWYQARGVY